jgi:capsular exopolysaccharide synthesis family protein
MDLHSHLRALRQRWWVVLATVMVALAVAGFVTVRAEPQYASSVTFFVTTPTRGVTDAYQGGLFLQQRVRSYADLLTSDRLAQSVAAEDGMGLTAGEIQGRVAAQVQPNSILLAATVTDTDQARSLKLSEAVANHFVSLVEEVETPPGAGDPLVKVEVVSGPRANPDPISPRPARNLALAGLLGLLLGVGLSVLRGMADTAVRDGATLQRVTSSPLLGQIPFDSLARSAPLIVGAAAQSARAEALRKLRTNLRFVDVHEPARVIAVTSAVQGEGKSTMSCNLAIALAEAGWQVLLVDADLRRPRVSEYLGLPAGAGLTDVLTGDVEVADVVQRWGDKSLLALPAGSLPPNPSELLGSKAMADLLVSLREVADIVIIDTAPVLAVTDGVVVAVQADGALLVTQHGKTSQAQVTAAAQALHSVGARVLGCVLNMAKVSRSEAYQYEAYQNTVASGQPAAAANERAAVPGAVSVRPDDIDAVAPGGPVQFGVRTIGESTQELSRIPR